MTESLNKTNENIEKIRPKCLFIDDEANMIKSLNRYFQDFKNFSAIECHSIEEAIKAINENSPKVLFLDNNLAYEGNEGLKIADLLKESHPDIEIYSTSNTNNSFLIYEYEQRGIKHIGKGNLEAIEKILSGEEL